MRGLIIGSDKEIADWAFRTYGFLPGPVERAIGVGEPGKGLQGAILFQEYSGSNICLSYYGTNTLSAGIIRAIARIALFEFGVSRLTVLTSKRNKRIIRALLRLGFVLEGAQRRYYGDRDTVRNTAIRLVIFKERIAEIAGVKLDEPNPVPNQL